MLDMPVLALYPQKSMTKNQLNKQKIYELIEIFPYARPLINSVGYVLYMGEKMLETLTSIMTGLWSRSFCKGLR